MSFWLNTKRVMRYGFSGFMRNGFVSLAAIVIMAITLSVIAGLMVSEAALHTTLQELTDKVDVTVYFTTEAQESQVLDVQHQLAALPEVATTTYVSRDQALAAFRERHQNDQLTIAALDELGDNPLGASLEIRAKDPSQYEAIAQYLSSMQSSETGSSTIIDRVNFAQNKTAIERLTNIINTSGQLGIGLGIFLALASILIVFNTIRLAIYTSRDEIGVMNIVGAGPWYVRGPFITAGILYGIVAGLIVLLIMAPVTYWLGPASERFLGTFNVFSYYTGSFAFLFAVIVGSGILLGAISSYLAVRRYLRA